ncbi:MAG: hypothetical protein M0Z36_14205 [Thermaerobacter sp.]|nr:hypothetical protein [Thermaerobacter sp.]
MIVIEILPILSPDDFFARYAILESVDNPDWHDGMGDAMMANQEREDPEHA